MSLTNIYCSNYINIYNNIKDKDEYIIDLIDKYEVEDVNIRINIDINSQKEFINLLEDTIKNKSSNGFEWNDCYTNIRFHYNGDCKYDIENSFNISVSPCSGVYIIYHISESIVKKLLELFKQHFKLEE